VNGPPEIKWPSIQQLADYKASPPPAFWENFPHRGLPVHISTSVNKPALRKLLDQNRDKLTTHQHRRGVRCLSDLQTGADAAQKGELPPVTVKNASSAHENGRLFMDKIATWVSTGFVAGPFKATPVPGFRANPLMAVVRKGAVRPIVNLSAPKGSSFNNNVDSYKLEKVRMATAKNFGYAVRKCGVNSKMSKFDKKDAYKLMPAKKSDWNKQGFTWLGRHFIELQQIFGGIPSVSNFDRLANTVLAITLAQCKIPKNLVFRTLDDVPIIAPGKTSWCEEFMEKNKNVCRLVNIKLAEDCLNNDKAFSVQTEGVVLGVRFNTKTQQWSLPKPKADELIRKLLWAAQAEEFSLNQTQQVLGSLNDLAQMCPFVKPYKALANKFLASFNNNGKVLLPMSDIVKADLMVCARIAETARCGLPIPAQPSLPPLTALTCYSDAAGCKFTIAKGVKHCHNIPDDRGVACVLLDKEGKVIGWSRVFWPKTFLS
jgi:hypothetical protein